MYFEIYQERSAELGLRAGGLLGGLGGAWRWRLKAANHEIIASGESYPSKVDCLHAVDLVKSGTSALTPVREV